MSSSKLTHGPQTGEFIAMMALMTSLVAMSIDLMLPALADIGADLGSPHENANQLVVTMVFLGLAIGQLLYGPLSDSIGRKPAIYLGYAMFGVGSLLAIFAINFPMMLIGRLLQGLGVAGPRGVSMALIRDRFAGRAMARVMSFIMVVFIVVPIIAPAIGQAILFVAAWRIIFVILLVLGVVSLIWFALRQPETLPSERRVPLSARRMIGALREVLANATTLGYTLMAGAVSAILQAYLNSSQQIFQQQYGLGALFPLFFAINALAIGLASFVNGRLVMRYGMRPLVKIALFALCSIALLFVGIALITAGQPPLWKLMAYLIPCFFCLGILFGNMNALAMEPLGHIAGVGSAVVGSLSTFVAIPLGAVIGQAYNGTVTPLAMGFAVLAFSALVLMYWANRDQPEPVVVSEE
ncbi:MAG TPA: Bcr/CflA family drug resistance efflux transporter [Chloroflexus aurantiacus]|jgi:DHA1 family bicyclomycin/chloramphenicol resistance-like MFS transporter|uniref:Drug resistance transporter, Bcr/CflA subfamily n=1 Tax=Chloroflexus aurantiacus (strain ATCC 29366 / DSM 635 / J-10-fl) TaxID=324602 RepID=A9W9N9_CHLAA|nr:MULTISPECIES: multidrug effflux MFS transporter [Chloroflexus]ABY34525.1 drug resistance transporter, Bcr/CflA subfamily [Chloroflexus aurantiacus J-10-fl]RMG52192.1 MAG: Bcr/CflA family efflux MFS transporter [Chloroflexota bacterium]HBW69501.1 Bcr/CflA family drug resistance efflux transporter [Chloroflexus aurantiacus]